MPRICIHLDCNKQAIYGKIDVKNKAFHCAKHAELGEIDVRSKKCQYLNCNVRANYGKNKPIHCKQHAESDEIDVVNKRCIDLNCNVRANYGKNKPIHCAKHAELDEIDVRSKKCQYLNCNVRANYGKNKPIHCAKHAESDEFDVVNKRCIHLNCDKQAAYGKIGRAPVHCSKHAESDEFDVKSKKCQNSDCNVRANYGKNKPIHCAKHKLPDEFDVKNKKCQYLGCDKQPTYGKIENKPVHCKQHAELGEFDVIHKKCQNSDCNVRASYGLKGYPPKFCANHKEKLHIYNPYKYKNHIETCFNGCNTKVEPDKIYCNECLINNEKFINEKYKTKKLIRKEINIKNLLELNNIKFIHDKKVANLCSKLRPDFLIQSNDKLFNIILEVDEHQHSKKNYNDRCEIVRMLNIFQDIGESCPLVFVRFNPDKYTILDQLNNKNNKILNGKERDDYLIKYLNLLMQKPVSEFTEYLYVVYLFYDDFNSLEIPNYKAIDNKNIFYCNDCNVLYNTNKELQAHLISDIHLDKLDNLKLTKIEKLDKLDSKDKDSKDKKLKLDKLDSKDKKLKLNSKDKKLTKIDKIPKDNIIKFNPSLDLDSDVDSDLE
jgi:hypothetical protein